MSDEEIVGSEKSMKEPVPIRGERNVLVTSALPYVNNVCHLGNLIGAVLSADVFARYLRQVGVNSVFICGTDEYGTATETKAQQEGMTPREICDKYHALHREIYEWFEIEFDHFGRTSTEKQTEITQEIFWDLHRNGFISEGSMEQLRCETCERFLADRYVMGTCPQCGFEDARGDQCDNCGTLLNPTQLINPTCALCKSAPVIRKTNHLFLDLPKLQDPLRDWVRDASVRGQWSSNAIAMTNTWLDRGLEQRCITRDLRWGTPVPLEGYTDKVFYVWFDACIGYLSITAALTEKWREWWQPDEDAAKVELYQFMGKDNIPFHSVVFPSSQIGTGKKWTMVHHLSTTEYLNYESGKFSKSRGVGVFGNDAALTGITVDVWRYYLVINRPEQADSLFTWQDFQTKNNDELLQHLGNFMNRTSSFLKKYFNLRLPKLLLIDFDREFVERINAELREYHSSMQGVGLKAGLKRAMAISKIANQYVQANEPWRLFNTDKERCGSVVALAANMMHLLGVILQPFLGRSFVTKVLKMVGLEYGSNSTRIPTTFMPVLEEDSLMGEPILLYEKISDELISELRAKYGGVDGSAPSAGSGGGGGIAENNVEAFRLDLRVGTIVSVEENEASDKLFNCLVDIGEDTGPRPVVAGLRDTYQADELRGSSCVLVCNLVPATLAGMESRGMILVGEKKDKVRILQAAEATIGDIVTPEGVGDVMTDPPLDRKAFQAASKPLRIGADSVVEYKKTMKLIAGPGAKPVLAQGVPEGGKVK
uniref:methionine--tRNA ligase n=1 Tax=Compsopogon caeruleus TaxID=31354 RepID=A0A7S1XA67_9RHOD|mmetsp:Transcript_11244/g.22617  ORF Transcript_11244/g.22617 Transcript_11244/m.22617 type:complete len:766 (+) Transcript_11244:58-2355(+)|eukprot:CAMPEP_0184684748 /NCGR_PEP_ID=MMETSP0312-20130426/16567_1 /TAXON_ID=31354 /ORGANISM="Compsopogon coeruleus, Strain SAG 36.94" /LENGTH=765 /DNA_ID=CAMNT_0027138261 /DNA_START=9 /DNA_END=2306 /DNA_ORIENTATION=-